MLIKWQQHHRAMAAAEAEPPRPTGAGADPTPS